MRKAQILIVLTFIALFGAGAVSALLATRLGGGVPPKPPGPGSSSPSWLTRELNLAPDQQEKMREIWSGLRDQMQAADRDKRRELSKQRDEEIRGLLTDEQKKQYDEIHAAHDKKLKELREAAEAAMRRAEQRTREILTPEQQTRYDQLLKQRNRSEDGRGGPGRNGPPQPGSQGGRGAGGPPPTSVPTELPK